MGRERWGLRFLRLRAGKRCFVTWARLAGSGGRPALGPGWGVAVWENSMMLAASVVLSYFLYSALCGVRAFPWGFRGLYARWGLGGEKHVCVGLGPVFVRALFGFVEAAHVCLVGVVCA